MRFQRDMRHAKLFGVCAGISAMTRVDALLVRVGLVVLTVGLLGKWGVFAYLVVAACAPRARRVSSHDAASSGDRFARSRSTM